jgi:hypothetical protein
MSVLDFLFEGSAPTPGSSTQTTESYLPDWYNEYTKNMLGRAQAIADIPYSTFPGPRIAGFTPTEKTGFEMTKQAAGAFNPFLQGAQTALGAAGTTFPQMAKQYMSPYTEGVVNRIADVGLRQLQEKFLPAIGQEFIQAGQFGPGPASSRMGEFGARALRDVQESILGQQAQALESGYKTAADIYGEDVRRMGDLASRYGVLGEAAQALGLRGAEAYGGVGAAERGMQQRNLDLAYQDFLRQQGYPEERAKFLSSMLSGVRLPETTIQQRTDIPAQPGGSTGIEDIIDAFGGIEEIGDIFGDLFGGKSGG